MVGLRYRILIMEDQVQVVIREILGMDRGLTTMGDSVTTQVLLRKGLKLLKLGTQTLGMQFGATTVMEKVILLLLVLNQELGASSFISKHYS